MAKYERLTGKIAQAAAGASSVGTEQPVKP
jgi:hypothetical protein